MILPPLSEDCNDRFPAITRLFFDDHHERTEHHLRQRLKQLAPTTLEGGRAILWFCRWCQKPWFELGRAASFVCLSETQVVEIAQQLGAEVRLVSSFPSSMCPLCAAIHLGGMPRIEEYAGRQGYRFTWEGMQSPYARFFCLLYASNAHALQESLRKACSTHGDIPTSPIEHRRSVLRWLKTLPDPAEHEVTVLSQSLLTHVNRLEPPKPGFSWCGSSWLAWCPPLGHVLVALGMTFPLCSICSSSLLVACWRQITQVMESVLSS